jgi:diguanylate cyclase (GGDEF)-like protein
MEQHIQKIRAEGFLDYTVRPGGKRDIYSAIIYLEPFTGRNLRAFGYDMFSESVRRAAMERARDENMVALSGKVTLVQETDEDVQSGTLMYVPVYRTGMPVTTVAERRAAIYGWVYSPYRMKDLMRGTLGNYVLRQGERHIILQIYDGNEVSDETLLYDSRSNEGVPPQFTSADLTKMVHVNFFGEPWTLKFTQLGGLSALADDGAFRMVLISGTSISLLLFGLIISLVRAAHYLESIRRLAETDSLTGVYNRRKIIDLAESEFVRARRQRHPLTILMTDLNFFKQINDNYGHIIGDHALRLAAHAIQSTVRKNIDKVGRFGGDEFLVILPEISQAQLENICMRLRANVAEKTQNISGGIHEVSLSIGAAELAETIQTLDELIEQADQAMYADKKRWK